MKSKLAVLIPATALTFVVAPTMVAAWQHRQITTTPASPTAVPSGSNAGTVQSTDIWVSIGLTPTIFQW